MNKNIKCNLLKKHVNPKVTAMLYYMKVFTLCLIGGMCYIKANAQNIDLEWAINMGGSDIDQGYAVAVDTNGNVYVAGVFRNTANFDPAGTANLTAWSNADAFIAKYDVNGNYIWAKAMGGNGIDQANGIAVDADGNVYVTGGKGNANFNPGNGAGTLPHAGASDVFVAKYDTDGNYVWAQSLGGSGGDRGEKVSIDAAGNVYVTGWFGSTNFNAGAGTATLATAGGLDVFIAKYDANGNHLWVKGFGGRRDDYAYNIAADDYGNIYFTGSFSDSVDFDPGTGTAMLTSAGGTRDLFLARYDANGNYVWANRMGNDVGSHEGYGLAVDVAGNVYLTGRFYDSVDFDPEAGTATLIAAGSPDGFTAKYDSSGNCAWAINTGAYAECTGVAVDAYGYVYVTGQFDRPGDFDPGPDSAMLIPVAAGDVFIARYDANGNYVWAKSLGSGTWDRGTGVTVDATGSVFVTGYISGAAIFDPAAGTGAVTLMPQGHDVFVLKLSCEEASSSLFSEYTCADSYEWNDSVYTTAGTYTKVFFNTAGCDSIVTLDLTFYQIEHPVITTDSFTLGVTGTYATYQWLKDGVAIPGATESTYTVTENGDYQVRVTNENGCETTSDVYEVNNVSIDDRSMEQYISTYPNPAKDLVHISSPVAVNLLLTTLDGRSIHHIANATHISVHGLPDGMYFLRILDKGNNLIKVEKIVVGN